MKAISTFTAVLLAVAMLPDGLAAGEEKVRVLSRAQEHLVVPATVADPAALVPRRGQPATQPPASVADAAVSAAGPAEVVDGGVASYSFFVHNGSSLPLPPFTVDVEVFGLAFGALVTNGWNCTLTGPTGVCEWPNDLQPGDSTPTVGVPVDVVGPYGDETTCTGERSPCAWFQAQLGLVPQRVNSGVILNGNTPPLAVDDFATVGRPAVPTLIDVLANDGDADVDPLTLSIAFQPADGTAVLDPGGHILYTPNPSFSGHDVFVYRIEDPSGATDTGIVRVAWGSAGFEEPLGNFGNVEPGRVVLYRMLVANTTASQLIGNLTYEPVPASNIPDVLAGTGYDLSQVVFDPDVFQPTFLSLGSSNPQFILHKTRPDTTLPVGTVYLARARLVLHPVADLSVTIVTVTHVVVRAADAGEVPVHVNDDTVTVLMDRMSVVRPLGNDVSVAGISLGVSGAGIAEPWNGAPPLTRGQVRFLFPFPFLGLEFTPEPGFQGTTDFWYAASELPGGNFGPRYDYAKVTVNVIPAPPPPVALASGSTTLCGGSAASLTGSGGARCAWSPAAGLDNPSSCAPTASPSSTTMYSLTVFDAFDQPSTNLATVTVTVAPAPLAAASGSASIPVGGSAPLSGSGGVSCSWTPAMGLSNAASCSPMASPAATTTYDLVVTSAAGCASTNPASATVTVVQPPVAVASGSAAVCAGGSAPLSGSGGVSCSWSPAAGLSNAASCAPMASPSATTTYSLVVTDTLGQTSTNAATVTVTVEPPPVAAASGSASIPVGGSAPLSGSGGASCAWSPAAGLDNAASCAPIASPAVTTTYSLVVASASGCLSTNPATATITVLPVSGAVDLAIAALIMPAEAETDETIAVTVWTINDGTGAAGPSTTRLYLSLDNVLDPTDLLVGSAGIAGLASGVTHSFTVGVTMPSRNGNRFLIAVADADGQVVETNELNNTHSGKVKVKRTH